MPAAGDAVGEAELDPGAAVAGRAQAPAAALVDAGHRRPGHVVRLGELDDLDQPAHLGRADLDQHPVAGAEADSLLALDLPAGDPRHEVQGVVGVGDVVPDQLRGRRDDDRLVRRILADHGEAALGGEAVERVLHHAGDVVVDLVEVGLGAELLAQVDRRPGPRS